MADTENEVPEGYVVSPMLEGFDHTVGPLYAKTEADGAHVMGFRVAKRHVNGMNNCHGGMLAGFADVAWGMPLSGGVYLGWLTVTLTTYFLRPALLGQWVEGKSVVINAEDDLFTLEGRIWCGDQSLITGSAVYKGLRPRSA